MMVVVTIIALFAALVLPKMIGQADKARKTAARAQINAYLTALGSYKLDTGVFPTTEEGLQGAAREARERQQLAGTVSAEGSRERSLGPAVSLSLPRRARRRARHHQLRRRRPTRRRRDQCATLSVGKTSIAILHSAPRRARRRHAGRDDGGGRPHLADGRHQFSRHHFRHRFAAPQLRHQQHRELLQLRPGSRPAPPNSRLRSAFPSEKTRSKCVPPKPASTASSLCRTASPSSASFPNCPTIPDAPRSFLLYPGGTAPRFGVQLVNRRNVERIVRVDPDHRRSARGAS